MANIDFTNPKTFSAYFTQNTPRKPSLPKRTRLIISLVALIAVLFGLALSGAFVKVKVAPPVALSSAKEQKAFLATYTQNLEQLATQRGTLLKAYKNAGDGKTNQAVLAEAGATLFDALRTTIMPAWIGTEYDFNGMTATPRQGSIACGYFIASVLTDAGFRVERISLGQAPSELIIRSLVSEDSTARYSGKTGPQFMELIKTLAPGIYLLGLDTHVGFLVIDSDGASFIHASRMAPYGVIRENPADSYAVMNSQYRVLGNLLVDNTLLLKWLGSEKIVTKR